MNDHRPKLYERFGETGWADEFVGGVNSVAQTGPSLAQMKSLPQFMENNVVTFSLVLTFKLFLKSYLGGLGKLGSLL